jgi:hypothetical protein
VLVQITHLKAPWPEGAQVGDTLDFDVLPPWAAGKCEAVDARPEFIVNPAEPGPEPVPASIVEAEKQAAEEREALEKRAKKLKKG